LRSDGKVGTRGLRRNSTGPSRGFAGPCRTSPPAARDLPLSATSEGQGPTAAGPRHRKALSALGGSLATGGGPAWATDEAGEEHAAAGARGWVVSWTGISIGPEERDPVVWGVTSHSTGLTG
jgi:hypothetical protein